MDGPPYYTATNFSLPMDFDPHNQHMTILMPNGTEDAILVEIPLAYLNTWRLQTLKSCIVYGSQLGGSLIMLMMVAITTRRSKRLQPIFWLNMTSLTLAFIRAMLLALFYAGPFQNIYPYLSGDYSSVPKWAYAQSVLGTIATLLLLCTIEASLVLQTNVVCLTMATNWRLAIVLLSIVLVLTTCISRIIYTVVNIEMILKLYYYRNTVLLAKMCLITETASIWYFCAVFVGKLAWTMYIRKSMGLKLWGPMQIICISGGCTLIIPSIFAILEWFPTQAFPDAGSVALTVVAIFLPLSSVWASMSVSDNSSPIRMQEPRLKFGSQSLDSNCGDATGSTAGMEKTDSNRGLMAYINDRKMSRSSGKSTFSTNSTAVEYSDDHDPEAKHSNAFFGVSKFGQKGHSTTFVRKGSSADLDEDIEMQDGVRVHTVFEVARCAPETADGGESTYMGAKRRKEGSAARKD